MVISNSSPSDIHHILDSFRSRNDLVLNIEHLWVYKQQISFVYRLFNRIRLPLDIDNINRRMMDSIRLFNPDILFIIKGLSIYPWNLSKIRSKYPKIKIVSWSLDDMYGWHNRSFYYNYGLKYYDIVFSTKSYNITELKLMGAKRVEFLYQAYSKVFHNPCPLHNCKKHHRDILFIGYAEKERYSSIQYLARHGLEIDIYGSGWDDKRYLNSHPNIKINRYDLLGDKYAEALSCYKISLCFLRKINRDLHTSRSVEIPACGGFMIAERTKEHKKLFEEDREAVYFDTNEELLEKTKYYLNNEQDRRKIALAGYNRTKQSKYSYDDMLDIMLKII